MLNQLPPAYQEAIRIVDLEGATQQDAARRAGVSLSGMKSRVQRAASNSVPWSRRVAGSLTPAAAMVETPILED